MKKLLALVVVLWGLLGMGAAFAAPEDAGTPGGSPSPAATTAPAPHPTPVAKPAAKKGTRPAVVGRVYITRYYGVQRVYLPVGPNNAETVRHLLAAVASITPVTGKRGVYQVRFKKGNKNPELDLEIQALVNLGRIVPETRGGRPTGRYLVFSVSDAQMEAARARPAYEALRGVRDLRGRQQTMELTVYGDGTDAHPGIVKAVSNNSSAITTIAEKTISTRNPDSLEMRLRRVEEKTGLRPVPPGRATIRPTRASHPRLWAAFKGLLVVVGLVILVGLLVRLARMIRRRRYPIYAGPPPAGARRGGPAGGPAPAPPGAGGGPTP